MFQGSFQSLFSLVTQRNLSSQMKRRAEEHICIAQGHRQKCGEGQRDERVGSGWRGATRRNGISVVMSTIKIQFKINKNYCRNGWKEVQTPTLFSPHCWDDFSIKYMAQVQSVLFYHRSIFQILCISSCLVFTFINHFNFFKFRNSSRRYSQLAAHPTQKWVPHLNVSENYCGTVNIHFRKQHNCSPAEHTWGRFTRSQHTFEWGIRRACVFLIRHWLHLDCIWASCSHHPPIPWPGGEGAGRWGASRSSGCGSD